MLYLPPSTKGLRGSISGAVGREGGGAAAPLLPPVPRAEKRAVAAAAKAKVAVSGETRPFSSLSRLPLLLLSLLHKPRGRTTKTTVKDKKEYTDCHFLISFHFCFRSFFFALFALLLLLLFSPNLSFRHLILLLPLLLPSSSDEEERHRPVRGHGEPAAPDPLLHRAGDAEGDLGGCRRNKKRRPLFLLLLLLAPPLLLFVLRRRRRSSSAPRRGRRRRRSPPPGGLQRSPGQPPPRGGPERGLDELEPES